MIETLSASILLFGLLATVVWYRAQIKELNEREKQIDARHAKWKDEVHGRFFEWMESYIKNNNFEHLSDAECEDVMCVPLLLSTALGEKFKPIVIDGVIDESEIKLEKLFSRAQLKIMNDLYPLYE